MTLVWQDARRSAKNVRDKYWDGRYPVKVSEISRKMGVMTYRATLPAGLSGMIIKEKGSEPRSYADADEPDVCRRFTFAHELGHYVERTTLADDDDFAFKDGRSEKYDLHEFYADEFAGALLMPEDDFVKMQQEGKSLIDMAARFGVSLSAVRKRRECLERTSRRAGEDFPGRHGARRLRAGATL